MLLTNSTINGKVIHQLKEPNIQSEENSLITSRLCNVTNLNFVTDFDASYCKLLSGHLEQLSIACPNLKRLDLNHNESCLESLKGLKSIVNQCHSLQGLNLDYVHATGVQKCIELWELLSEIKMLNCLTVQTCTMEPFEKMMHMLNTAFKACSKICTFGIFAINLQKNHPYSSCHYALYKAYPQLLAYFPVLIYFHVIGRPFNVADIITNCKQLKYFGCHVICCVNISFLTVAPNQYLQHLNIHSQHRIDKVFMDSVSAHGKLEHVFLSVRFMTTAGITALMQNSPKLYFCDIRPQQILDEENKIDLEVFKDTLKNKFLHRKLFNLNSFYHYNISSM